MSTPDTEEAAAVAVAVDARDSVREHDHHDAAMIEELLLSYCSSLVGDDDHDHDHDNDQTPLASSSSHNIEDENEHDCKMPALPTRGRAPEDDDDDGDRKRPALPRQQFNTTSAYATTTLHHLIDVPSVTAFSAAVNNNGKNDETEDCWAPHEWKNDDDICNEEDDDDARHEMRLSLSPSSVKCFPSTTMDDLALCAETAAPPRRDHPAKATAKGAKHYAYMYSHDDEQASSSSLLAPNFCRCLPPPRLVRGGHVQQQMQQMAAGVGTSASASPYRWP